MYEIKFFGWCNEDGHDKVWGWAEVGSDRDLYCFWGKRGAKFTFKDYTAFSWGDALIQKLVRQKTRDRPSGRPSGRYIAVDPSDIERVVPGFDDEFQNQFTLARLFEKFHGNQTL